MEMLVRILPPIVSVIAWIVALVFAERMMRNDRGRPERLLLIGSSLILASSIVGSVWAGPYTFTMEWLVDTGTDYMTVG